MAEPIERVLNKPSTYYHFAQIDSNKNPYVAPPIQNEPITQSQAPIITQPGISIDEVPTTSQFQPKNKSICCNCCSDFLDYLILCCDVVSDSCNNETDAYEADDFYNTTAYEANCYTDKIGALYETEKNCYETSCATYEPDNCCSDTMGATYEANNDCCETSCATYEADNCCSEPIGASYEANDCCETNCATYEADNCCSDAVYEADTSYCDTSCDTGDNCCSNDD